MTSSISLIMDESLLSIASDFEVLSAQVERDHLGNIGEYPQI
jgi:hypothetical protein